MKAGALATAMWKCVVADLFTLGIFLIRKNISQRITCTQHRIAECVQNFIFA